MASNVNVATITAITACDMIKPVATVIALNVLKWAKRLKLVNEKNEERMELIQTLLLWTVLEHSPHAENATQSQRSLNVKGERTRKGSITVDHK